MSVVVTSFNNTPASLAIYKERIVDRSGYEFKPLPITLHSFSYLSESRTRIFTWKSLLLIVLESRFTSPRVPAMATLITSACNINYRVPGCHYNFIPHTCQNLHLLEYRRWLLWSPLLVMISIIACQGITIILFRTHLTHLDLHGTLLEVAYLRLLIYVSTTFDRCEWTLYLSISYSSRGSQSSSRYLIQFPSRSSWGRVLQCVRLNHHRSNDL